MSDSKNLNRPDATAAATKVDFSFDQRPRMLDTWLADVSIPNAVKRFCRGNQDIATDKIGMDTGKEPAISVGGSASLGVKTPPATGSRQVYGHTADYFCGAGAAIVNIYCTFPVNKLIFRQMLHGSNFPVAIKTLRSDGLGLLYRGVAPPLIQRSLSLSLMFGTFGTYNTLLDRYAYHIIPSSYGRFCLAGFMAGSTEAFMCPFERIQMLLQDDRCTERYSNTVDAFKKLRRYGIKEYYRGFTAILLRNGPSNILFFTFRNKIKHDYFRSQQVTETTIANRPKNGYLNDMCVDFISGAVVGALISTLFYPLNVIRTKMQTQVPGSPHLSLWQAAKLVYEQRDRSIRKIYRGVHLNYTRSFMSWGIVNSCFELFHKILVGTDQPGSQCYPRFR